MKRILRIASLLMFVCAALAVCSNFAQAQRLDIAFGVSTIDAPGASTVSPTDTSHSPVSLTGGAYPGFSGDAIIFHNLGFGGEVFWKASQGSYPSSFGTVPFRPVFYDFDAVYSPRLATHIYLEAVAGIGGESVRFYCSTCFDPFTGTNYVSSNHFMGDFGAGIKLYATHSFFIRPEARLYLVNNNQEFSSPRALRYGISIGYTLK